MCEVQQKTVARLRSGCRVTWSPLEWQIALAQLCSASWALVTDGSMQASPVRPASWAVQPTLCSLCRSEFSRSARATEPAGVLSRSKLPLWLQSENLVLVKIPLTLKTRRIRGTSHSHRLLCGNAWNHTFNSHKRRSQTTACELTNVPVIVLLWLWLERFR